MVDKNKVVSVDEVINDLLEKKELFPKTLYGTWEEIVGSLAAEYSQPRKKIRNILHVNVSDPVWKHHLILQKEAILRRLNQIESDKPLEDIIFHIGEVKIDVPVVKKISKGVAKKKVKKRKKHLKLRCLTLSEKKMLAGIEDIELRRVCRSLLRKVN